MRSEVHTLELTKYELDEQSISGSGKLQQCAFLLIFAQNCDAETLTRLLPWIEFETAITTIEIISAKTEDKQMYDQREKAQRDYEVAVSGARQEGLKQGLERGLAAGRIQTLKELLGDASTSTAALAELHLHILTSELVETRSKTPGVFSVPKGSVRGQIGYASEGCANPGWTSAVIASAKFSITIKVGSGFVTEGWKGEDTWLGDTP